jgi:uncharacterized protein YxjI
VDKLSLIDGLVVTQQKEWGEILTGFETKNKYAVSDTAGSMLYYAAEEEGSTLARWFLKALRPFTITVLSEDGDRVLQVRRPFRFFFHRAEVVDGKGRLLGVIEKQFSLLRRIYSVSDGSGQEAFQLFGPILHPWTFEIRQGDSAVGKITKEWSGLLKEGFTDADNFGVKFPADWDIKLKALFLGAVFLIDFVHFEDTGNN